MILVVPQPEPANFDSDVRRPGQQFLRRVPLPSNAQFKKHEYWRKALRDLRTAYSDICAYCACWIPFDGGTLDHYLPKSAHPADAYEWSNFRLAQERMNSNKGESTDVLDPFHIDPGWFVLDFSTMLVRLNNRLKPEVRKAVNKTINILQLNSETLVRLRYSRLRDYSNELTPIRFLERYYPFIAS